MGTKQNSPIIVGRHDLQIIGIETKRLTVAELLLFSFRRSIFGSESPIFRDSFWNLSLRGRYASRDRIHVQVQYLLLVTTDKDSEES